MANDNLIVELSAQIQWIKAGLDNASKEIGKFNTNTNNAARNTEKDFNQIGAAAGKIGGVLAGAFAAGSIISFGKSIVETTAKFETFAAVLTNTLGSASQAEMAMQMITDFAATTPFSVEELTGAFVKLANQGFKPSYDEMRKLGDLASSTGKSFGQLAEAILDAQTGEFERLKEFGVKASVAGDKVTFTFKEVATTVQNTSSSIQKYLLALGDIEGVSGAAAAISNTLQGKLSNLDDSFTTLMKNMGDSNSGVLKDTVDLLGQLISSINIIGHADNMAEKLGIDQRGKNWMDKIPFTELQNLWGGVTYGQQGNIDLIATYDKLNKSISNITTSGGFKSYIAALEKSKALVSETSPQYKIYSKTIDNAKDALSALTAEEAKAAAKAKAAAVEAAKIPAAKAAAKTALKNRIEFKPTSMDSQAAVDYDISSLYPAELVNSYTSEMNLLNAAEDKRFQATDEYFGKYQAIYIPTEEKKAEILAYQNNLLAAQAVIAGTLTAAFEQMFTTLVDGGQNAFQAIFDAIKRLMIKIAAAIVVASILFILTGGLSAGGSKLGSIGEIASKYGGLGFDPIAMFQPKPKSAMIAMPSSSTGQGGYQVDIMGDKMRLLLDNQAIKNSRVV
jgi:hypothetical protein